MRTVKHISNVLEAGYAFKPVPVETFDQLLRVIRVDRRLALNQRLINRDGIHLGTVFMVGADPVAFHRADGQHYVLNT
jgi:hypothetical protein